MILPGFELRASSRLRPQQRLREAPTLPRSRLPSGGGEDMSDQDQSRQLFRALPSWSGDPPRDETAELVFLPRRGLPVGDPLGRFTRLTVGIFAEICSMAAHGKGLEFRVGQREEAGPPAPGLPTHAMIRVATPAPTVGRLVADGHRRHVVADGGN